MKKIFILLVLLSAISLVGCNGTNENMAKEENGEARKVPEQVVGEESIIIDTNVKTAEEALNFLKEGNKRFINDDTEIINVSSEKRDELEQGQSPYAIVISCSDSRVTPSHVFNAGLGELFEIRVAGNVLDDYALGSVEYGIEHLGCPLLVVMGHENCGAVTAAFEAYEKHEEVEGAIGDIVEAIEPSVEAVHGSSIEAASHANVRHTINQLNQNEVVMHAVKAGKLKIVGAYYDLDGTVEFLD